MLPGGPSLLLGGAPRPLPQLMSLEGHAPGLVEGTLGPRNATPPGGHGAPGPPQHAFPWAATLLAGVLITTIVVDVIGNLLVVVSVFRNKKLRKAGLQSEATYELMDSKDGRRLNNEPPKNNQITQAIGRDPHMAPRQF
ncbi:Melatonin receptor type 1A [Liparis tanakae]|uniref:Melatonin receptor type 1A n=1 Tax=Liparis tanakae TaxID=230148 RepID=A0A4Z2G0X8_9TELE|nr:Melatonin receptor type 1A [Liparis tanakae]